MILIETVLLVSNETHHGHLKQAFNYSARNIGLIFFFENCHYSNMRTYEVFPSSLFFNVS